MEGAYRSANFNFGIFGTDGLTDHLVTLFKDSRDDILVADTYIFKVERSWMTSIGTHLGPLGGSWIAICPLDHIKQLLNIGRHLIHRDTTLLTTYAIAIGIGVLTRHTSSQYRQRFCTNVLTELEILEEAKSTRLVVAPDVEVGLAILQRTYGVIPMIDIIHTLSMTHTATRETHKLGFQGCNSFRQILAKSILTPHKRLLREETDHIDASLYLLLSDDCQASFFTCLLGGEYGFVLFPTFALRFKRSLGYHNIVTINELDDKVLLVADITHKH